MEEKTLMIKNGFTIILNGDIPPVFSELLQDITVFIQSDRFLL
jgi:hypothetical protein